MNKEAQITELVLARLSMFPSNKKISIGRYGNLSKDQILSHIEKRDEIGKKFIEIELEYLKTISKGIIA